MSLTLPSPSTTAAQELVVPRSMPMIGSLDICFPGAAREGRNLSSPRAGCATTAIRRKACRDNDREGRVAGHEEVQNAIYRSIGNSIRAGRVNRLILLHGPNGSAKSSIVNALKRAMEVYSRESAGALYQTNWVFPSEKLVKGS